MRYKIIPTISFLLIALTAHAVPTSLDDIGTTIQPLYSSRGDLFRATNFTATSTTATSTFNGGVISASGIRFSLFTTCTALETDSSGFLQCGSDGGGGGDPDWSQNTVNGIQLLSPTTTQIHLRLSSTTIMGDANTGRLTATSGMSYINQLRNGDFYGDPDVFIQEGTNNRSYLWIRNSNDLVQLNSDNNTNDSSLSLLGGDVDLVADLSLQFLEGGGEYGFSSPNFLGTLAFSSLSAARWYTFPNHSGNIAVATATLMAPSFTGTSTGNYLGDLTVGGTNIKNGGFTYTFPGETGTLALEQTGVAGDCVVYIDTIILGDFGSPCGTYPFLAIGGSHAATSSSIYLRGSAGLFASSTSMFANLAVNASSTMQSLWVGIGGATTTSFGVLGSFHTRIASTTGATVHTIDWSAGSQQRILLQANSSQIVINSTSSNPQDGGRYILDVCQGDAAFTGTAFAGSGAQFAWKRNATTVITTTVNTCTKIGFNYSSLRSLYDVPGSSTPLRFR